MNTKTQSKARNEKNRGIVMLFVNCVRRVSMFLSQNHFYDLWTISSAKLNQERVNLVNEPFLRNIGWNW